jgi:hypothetical protein
VASRRGQQDTGGQIDTGACAEGPNGEPHVGTSTQDVKLWVEQMAVSLGYERVIWDTLPEAVRVR